MATIYKATVGGDGSTGTTCAVERWGASAFPSGAAQAIVTATVSNAWAWAGTINDPLLLDSSELKLEWTSTQSGGAVDRGAQVAVGGFYDRAITNVTLKLKARIKVNLTARFSRIYFWLGDGTNASTSADQLGSMSDDTWYEYEFDGNASGWGANMRYSITARGTDNSNNVGLTKFYIDWIRLNLG